MKTCPNCGSKMEADVNFCTVCGTNIKDVPLDGAQPVQPAPQQAPVTPQPQPVQKPVQPQAETPQQPVQNVQSTASSEAQSKQTSNQSQADQQPQQINDTFSKVSSQITTAVKNFDKESLWKWFVTSWKAPSAEQHGEKWYGVATLFVEMILFALSLGFGIKKWVTSIVISNYGSNAMNDLSQVEQSKLTGFFHGLTLDLFLLVLILGIGVIVSSYFANKFVHNDNLDFFNYTNKIVQMSNICSVLVLATVILAFVNLRSTIDIVRILIFVTALVFLMAGGICVIEGPRTNRDSFYGVLIYLVALLIFAFIAYSVVKNQVISQIQTAFNVDISQYFNQLKNYIH